MSILITAFEPYGHWTANASWLCLVELTRELPKRSTLVTRRYPVDFAAARARLAADLAADFDYVIHLGQAPGESVVRLEAIGLNVGGLPSTRPDEYFALEADGPPAYRSELPLGDWCLRLRQAGIPATLSFHAGTYLCNALLYWTHYLAEHQGHHTRAALIHVPLDVSQVLDGEAAASLPARTTATAVRLILEQLEPS
ncbi:MAG TPA: pyroglutamyl-peptidase I [Pirellulales bacterium]|nr:pyroglutamyl-peptidase I [Pirellulales bacterium]